LQKWIGTVDVKSTPVHFYAQISTSFSTADNAIPFDSIKFNLGNAYSATGEFVAPTSGIYYFACSGVGFNLGNVLNFSLQKKSGTGEWTDVGTTLGIFNAQRYPFTLQSTLQLFKDDQVRLFLYQGIIFGEDEMQYTHFLGWLIEEDQFPV
jgi:hypothetical protein